MKILAVGNNATHEIIQHILNEVSAKDIKYEEIPASDLNKLFGKDNTEMILKLKEYLDTVATPGVQENVKNGGGVYAGYVTGQYNEFITQFKTANNIDNINTTYNNSVVTPSTPTTNGYISMDLLAHIENAEDLNYPINIILPLNLSSMVYEITKIAEAINMKTITITSFDDIKNQCISVINKYNTDNNCNISIRFVDDECTFMAPTTSSGGNSEISYILSVTDNVLNTVVESHYGGYFNIPPLDY